MRKLYAIGFKNWVELRSALNPPKAKVTTAFYRSNLDHRRKKFPIKVVHHTGGKVLRCLASNIFSAYTGMYVAEGDCVEVPKEAAARLPEVRDGDG